MQAIIKAGPGDFPTVKEVSMPEIGDPNDVLLKVEAAGVCGTDIAIAEDRYYEPENISEELIMGHEGTGEIIATGGATPGVAVGDKVVFETVDTCGTCYFCVRGYDNLCSRWRHLGMNMSGTFSEYLRLPARMVHRVPESLSTDQAALIEPFSVAVHTMERIKVNIADSAVVIGPGIIGLLHMQALLLGGVGSVTVIGRTGDERRLEVAKQLGAAQTLIIDPDSHQYNAMVEEVTQKPGYDIVLETAGTASAVALSLELANGYGQVHLLGLAHSSTLNSINIVKKSLTVTGGKGVLKKHIAKALKIMATTNIDVHPFITHSYSLAKASDAFATAKNRHGVKVMLRP